DDLYKAGLPFLVAKKLKNTINAIKQKKTFYIQAYDDKGEPLESFETYTMYNEDDFHDFLMAVDGKGLESIDDNSEVPEVIRFLKHIRPNQHYRIKQTKKTFYIQAYNYEGEPLESFEPCTIIKQTKKTFYIQAYNNEAEPLESFEPYTTYNEDDFRDFLKAVDGIGLESIDNNSNPQ
ncbi:7228_t:CDS:2, partial [Gigaspora rosea]